MSLSFSCIKFNDAPFYDHTIIIICILFFFFKANLTKFAFQLLNGIGDFITLKDVLDPTKLPNWDKMTKDEILAKVGIKIK